LEQLPPEEVAHLALHSTSECLEAGEAVTLDDDRRTLLLLASGRMRVHDPSAAGPGHIYVTDVDALNRVAEIGR